MKFAARRLLLILIVVIALTTYLTKNRFGNNIFATHNSGRNPPAVKSRSSEIKEYPIVYTVDGRLVIQFSGIENSESPEKMLFLALVQDKHSFGPGRKFTDFLQVINSQKPKITRNLALLVSSKSEYIQIRNYFSSSSPEKLDFGSVTIVFYEGDGLGRYERKFFELQKERRRHIAILRNFLTQIALQDEQHLFWIDSDITHVPPGLADRFLQSGKDIVVPSCYLEGESFDYDLNTWKGQRLHPSEKELQEIRQGKLFVPRPNGAKFLFQMKDEGEFVEIDSVGGTVLYMKAEIFRVGVVFPPYYAVGTDWDVPEGWDGIETEGICYIAKTMGFRCWGMPNEIIFHARS
jgi:hypothetical protein